MPDNKETENEYLSKLSPEEKKRRLELENSRKKVKALKTDVIEECKKQSFTYSRIRPTCRVAKNACRVDDL